MAKVKLTPYELPDLEIVGDIKSLKSGTNGKVYGIYDHVVEVWHEDETLAHLRHDNFVHAVADTDDHIFVSEGKLKNLEYFISLIKAESMPLDNRHTITIWS